MTDRIEKILRNGRYADKADAVLKAIRKRGYNENNIGNLPRVGGLVGGVDVYELTSYLYDELNKSEVIELAEMPEVAPKKKRSKMTEGA